MRYCVYVLRVEFLYELDAQHVHFVVISINKKILKYLFENQILEFSVTISENSKNRLLRFFCSEYYFYE